MPKKVKSKDSFDEFDPVLKAYIIGGRTIIRTAIKGPDIIPVLSGMLMHATNEMVTQSPPLKGESPLANFILGADLVSNRVFQDAVFDFTKRQKEGN